MEKQTIFFVLLACSFATIFANPNNWFNQRLDHFNNQDLTMWKQRYLVNDTFWDQSNEFGGPIFVQIGGEGPLDDRDVDTFQINNYAQQYGALVLALEHRFYGESQPFDSITTENLQYLSSQQALADLAYFIVNIKETLNAPESPVVTFGCSYSGALAAWFRMKYPTVTIASIASSAPVYAVEDFYAYDDVVDNSFASVAGEACDSRIQSATDIVQSMLQSQSGTSQLESLFKTCGPIQSKLDIQNFMSTVMGNFQGVVQYNDDNRNEISRKYDITYICNMMLNQSIDSLQALINVNNLFLTLNEQECLDISYKDLVAVTGNSTIPNDDKSWTWQTCSEFGYFQTTDSPNQPFGDLVPLSFYTQLCQDVFDTTPNSISANINATNINYGGKNIPANGPTNIMFINGDVDPWHALGITQSISPSLPAILIHGTAHCSNVYATSEDDLPSLVNARKQIEQQIGVWLAQNNNNMQ